MQRAEVGVLGARSPVGEFILARLCAEVHSVRAFSRRADMPETESICWQRPGSPGAEITDWVSVLPLWELPGYFTWLQQRGARRLVVLSSTSRFAKLDSPDPGEQAMARRLIGAEEQLQAWAQVHGVEWVILRPTLIYGTGRDRNVAEIARFVRRWRFFPVLGRASGLRQPVHADDVAQACVAALKASSLTACAFNLSGDEILSYRDMVLRTAASVGVRPLLLPLPLWLIRAVLVVLRCLPACRDWRAGMAERMNRDQVFDHAEAARELGFAPRGFSPGSPQDPNKECA